MIFLPYKNNEVYISRNMEFIHKRAAINSIIFILRREGSLTHEELKKAFLTMNPHTYFRGKRYSSLIFELLQDTIILRTFDNKLRFNKIIEK